MSKFDTAELNDIRSLLADLQSQQDAAIGKAAPKAAPAPAEKKVEAPKTEAPKTEAPRAKKPRVVLQEVELSKPAAPKAKASEETVKLDAAPKGAPKAPSGRAAPVDDLPVVEFPVVEMPRVEVPKVQPVKNATPKAAPQKAAPAAPEDGFNLDKILTDISDVVDETRSDPSRSAEMLKAEKAARRQIVPGGPVVSPGPEIDRAPQEDPKPLTRKERRRLEKEARRAREIEEDAAREIVARDPVKASRACAKRVGSLKNRSMVVLVLSLIALYITMAGGLGWPLPGALNYVESPYLAILALIALQIISMLLGIDVIGLGFYNMVTGHPDRSSIVSLSCVTTLLHAMSVIIVPAWGGYLPYCAISCLLTAAMMREEKNRMAGRSRAYKAASMHTDPVGVRCHFDEAEGGMVAVKARANDQERFLREMERPDYTEKFTRLYAPIVLVAAIVFSIIATFMRGQPGEFFWVLASIMSVAAPLPVVCAYGRAYFHVSRRLLSEGAALASARCANTLGKAKKAVITDNDLFPSSAISVGEIRAYHNYTPEKLLSYTVGVTAARGLEISSVLAESLREKYGRPARVSKVQYYDFGGLSAVVENDSVLVGTVSFMNRIGINFGNLKGLSSAVLIAINNQPAGVIALEYHPSAQTFNALHALNRLKITPLLALRDFNITPEMVSALFEVKSRAMEEASADRIDVLTDPEYAEEDAVCAILTRDGAVPYAQVLQSADRLSAAVRSNLILGAFAGICGVLIMFYLACKGAYTTITPQNVLIYLVLWYIPSVFVTFHTRKGL